MKWTRGSLKKRSVTIINGRKTPVQDAFVNERRRSFPVCLSAFYESNMTDRSDTKRAYGEHVSHYLASERARLIVTILNLEKTTFDPFDSPSSNPGAFSEKKEKKEVEKLSKKSSIIRNDQVLEQDGFFCKIRREFVR